MEYCGAGSVNDLMRITDKTLNEEQISSMCVAFCNVRVVPSPLCTEEQFDLFLQIIVFCCLVDVVFEMFTCFLLFAAVLKDALKGLVYLHSLRKIHRDIKAGNILLNNKGEGKLGTFSTSHHHVSIQTCVPSAFRFICFISSFRFVPFVLFHFLLISYSFIFFKMQPTLEFLVS